MKNIFVLLAVSLFYIFPVTSSASAINLVEGATISINGKSHGYASYINDGVAKTGTLWSKESVWWSGLKPSIEISLNGKKKIGSISVQADSNDRYRVDYWDSSKNKWEKAFIAEITKTQDHQLSGLDLRESPKGLGITTDKLRVSAVSGDNHYSVSEVQAFSPTPTPAPISIILLGGGLSLLFFFKRKHC